MYKLIALDLDGTLLNSKKEIPSDNLQALLEAQEKGLKIIIASGRTVQGMRHIAEELNLKQYGGFLICFNGGLIMNYQTGEIIFQKLLDAQYLPYLYECSKKYGFQILSYKDGQIVAENSEDKYVQYISFANRMPILKVEHFLDVVNFPEPKCLIVGDPEPLHKLELEMSTHLDGKMNILRSDPFILELLPYGIDKSKGLSNLLEKTGITREELIACGDGYNDLEMIRYAGLGVAMDNAQPAVKEVADYITCSNEDSGVAEVLRRFYL